MDKDACCDGCRDGVSHSLHYSAAGTPILGGIMVAGRPWKFGYDKPPILIECAGNHGQCTWSAWWNDESLSDAAFVRRAKRQCWTIFPHPATRCPQHRQEHEEAPQQKGAA